MSIKRDKKPKGFTLIEVLIGLIIFAIGILAVAGMQITSTRGNFFSHNLMQATYVAQDRLEFLKYLNFDTLQLQAGNNDDKTAIISGVVFNRSYEVTSVNDPNGTYLRINYTVTWSDGSNHRISFTTIRAQ